MKRKNKEKGQSMVEYIILVALIALVAVSATKKLGVKIHSKINEVKRALDSGVPVRLGPRR